MDKNGQKWSNMAKLVKNGQNWFGGLKVQITLASVNDTPVKLDNFAANSSLLSSKFSPKKEIYLVGTFNIQQLKALVVKNSVLHDFGFGKVSPAKQL